MAKRTDIYQSPLEGRYPSKEMLENFSDDTKFSNWRKLWVALAKAEKNLGKAEVTDEMIAEMLNNVSNINYDVADARERVVRHDVMAHVYAYGQQCPTAAGIIHWGATSCYVTDNTDIFNLTNACKLIKKTLLGVISLLAKSAVANKDVYCLGYTHYQPAAPTTIGKRECLWIQDFLIALSTLEAAMSQIKMLGCRGATGTSSTFMEIFDGEEQKVKDLDKQIAESFGYDDVFAVSGQTYPRILDAVIMNALQIICVAAYKMGDDIRLMQHDKEVEEPFEKSQIGSSAMAYKRNPMRSERMCSLARYVINDSKNAADTAATQWLERTLDDSANRRITLPQCFLATESVLIIAGNVSNGLVINKAIINKRLNDELPFMATENIIMDAVKNGGNRQELHEHIRQHSMAAGTRVKQEGLDNNLLELISNDPIFGMTFEEVKAACDPKKLSGRASHQVVDFIEAVVKPILEENQDLLTDINTEVNV